MFFFCIYIFKGLVFELITYKNYTLEYAIIFIVTVIHGTIFVLACIVFSYGIFETSFYQAIYMSSIALSMQSIAENIVTLILSKNGLIHFAFQFYYTHISLLPIFVLTYTIIYITCYFLFVKNIEYHASSNLSSLMTTIAIVVILMNVMLGALGLPVDESDALRLFSFMTTTRMLIGLLCLIQMLYLSKLTKLQIDYEKINYILHQQKKNYEIAKESMDTVNINAHDLRKSIEKIIQAMERTQTEKKEVKERILEMEEYLDMVDTTFNTGNPALDVILTEKARVCKHKQIQFSALVDASGLKLIKDMDIYSLFSNAVDNAIEATSGILDKDSRIIGIKVRNESFGIVIHIENTFSQQPVFKDGIPQTLRDKRYHGYGVRSIMKIVEKYNGNLKMHTEDELFYLDCLIPYPQ